MKIIALDIGTSSMKSILYEENGELIKVFGHEYYSDYPKEGYVEQDPDSWEIAMKDVLKQMASFCKKHNYNPRAITVASQRSSLIAVDKNGVPLRNAIMWQDKRTVDICDSLIKKFGLDYFYKKTGLRINPYFVLPKILWMKEEEKDLYDKTFKFLGVMDYVVYLMTGHYITDHSQACRTCLMDISTFEWDQDLLDLAGIKEDKLPTLVRPGTIAGPIKKELAELTGLDMGIEVILAGGDQQNAALALGVISEGTAEANTGTGSFVISALERPHFDPECRVLCQAAAIPGKWIMEAGIFNTGAVYRWFRDNFYKEFTDDTKLYKIMNSEAEKSPPGSRGITMIPHFQGSAAPYWNPYAKGVFFNLSLNNNRGDFTRSIMEGIASELATNIRLIEKLTNDLECVSVAGGMTQSDLFCKIQSNLYNKKVIRSKNSEATSLGAAMIGFLSLNVYDNIEEAYEKMTVSKPDIFDPDEELADIYYKVYERKVVLYDAISFGDVYEAFS